MPTPNLGRMALASVVACAVSVPARATDLRMLSNLLSPSYVAMNFTTVCSQVDAKFLADTSGPRGTAIDYVQHMKTEVIEKLEMRDAEAVLLDAANAARAVALGFVRGMSGGSDAEVTHRVSGWYEAVAKPFVRGVVAAHDEDGHKRFNETVAALKQY